MSENETGRKLRDCLNHLTDGKATERKKQLDNLKGYLINPAYLHHMNKSSSKGSNVAERGGIAITWNKVFNKIKDYIEQECNKFREKEANSESLSSIVRNNIAKEKRCCSDLFRCYVKAMKQNKQYEMAKPVVLHILAVLNESYTQASLGVDYSNVFLKYILYDPFMCLNIPSEILDDAIWFYKRIIKKPPPDYNRGLMTQILLHLVTTRLNRGSWDCLKMLEFFIHMFESVMSEKASRHHENLLQCLLLVSQNLKCDYPLQLCDVGERVLLPIMQLWKTRPSEKTQELMLEFMRFQLALHHPKGAQKVEDGAQAHDWKMWKNHLISLYKLIMTELTALCERNKYPLGKELILKPVLISVAVEVFAQVFIEPIGTLDITQASTSFDTPGPSKKRKIDVSFRTLIDNLSSSKIIPWLQVISTFLTKYSAIISITEAICLLDALIDVHMSCNDIETKNWLLRCCQSFVQAFGSQDTIEKNESGFQWQRVWELAVKSVALMQQCQEAGHGLLATLLSYKLVTPKAEFYNLYAPGASNRVTEASLKSLAVFLQNFSSSSMFGFNSSCSRNLSTESFENQILEWLFSRKNDDNSPFQVVSDDVDLSTYEMFARVAALLCLQNTDCGFKIDILSTLAEPFQWIREMEDELIIIKFGKPSNQMKPEKLKGNPPSSRISHPIWDKILKFFIDATGSIFEEHICNKQFSTVSSFIRHSCLLFEMLQLFYFEGIIRREDLESNIFMSHLKRSLQAIVEMFHKSGSDSENIILLKDFVRRIICSINQKYEMYGQTFSEPFIIQIIQSVPEEILMHLLNFSLNNPEPVTENVQNNNVDDMFDDEFAQPQRTSFPVRKDEDLDFDSNLEKDSFQLMDMQSLPENFQLQMQCLEIIGDYFHLLKNENYHVHLNNFPNNMLKKLVSSLPEKDKRFKGATDIHLVLHLLNCILLTKDLDDEVIGKVMNSFRLLLNQLSQMQELCQSVLKLFRLLFHHIYNRSPIVSSNVARNKSRMLHMLYVLVERELEDKSSSQTALHIVENLMKIVQVEPSSTWNAENRPSGGGRVAERSEMIIDSLIRFMKSPFTPVRLFVAKNINDVISAEISDQIFQKICTMSFEMLSVPERENLSKKDEFSNQVSTFLHYLTRVILQFPCLEIESVFIMLKCIKQKLADQTLISTVLKQVATSLGYENIIDFVEPHLNYLCQRWFDAKFELEEFPVLILEESSLDSFIKNFYKILVPLLFNIGDIPSITFVAEKLHLPVQDLICACLPRIQSLILSDVALHRNGISAAKCQQLLLGNIPAELCKQSINNKLDELLVCLLSMIKEDGRNHTSVCQIYNKHSITSEELVTTISYIISQTNNNESFTKFLSQKANFVQSIFLSINTMLHKALRSHESRRVLCMYQCFLSLLLPGLKSDLNCSIYVIREIVYSIINFLTDKRYLKGYIVRDDVCIEYCCNILFCLFKETIEDFKEPIGEFLPFITSNLTPFASKAACGKKVISLLKFLLIDSENHLVQYIPYLDPFPSDDIFCSLSVQQKHVKYKYGELTLEQEIQFFLKSCRMMGRATKNGLDHLCNQLNSRKKDFHKILSLLKEKTVFTEDVEKSILHELICQLASLCSPDNDFEIQKAASNCLGAIGPVAFSSLVLQPSSHATTEKGHENLNALQKSYVIILNILTEYLFHKSIHIKVATSKVLNDLLSTKIGYLFFKEYSKLFKNSNIVKYIFPFYACQNPKQLSPSCKYKVKMEDIDVSIWLPNRDEHSEWIKKLVCTVLECGLTRNNFYECLVPLCREETSFCEKIIPYLIYMVLLTENQELQKFLSSGISLFFSQFSQWMEKTSNDKEVYSSPPREAVFHKASVQTMLSILHYVWLHPNLNDKTPGNILKDLWLDINYLDVAQAAQYCSAHFTAILYTELWCDIEREKNRVSVASTSTSDSGSLDCSPLSFIGSQDREKASLVYDVLLDSYSRIGDSDAISGCDLITADSQAILKHSYLIEKKWDGLLKLNDKQNSTLETLQALQLTGLNHILLQYSQSLLQNKNNTPPQEVLEYQCQAAWRMSQWDLPVVESSSHGFQEYFYKCQQSYISENNPVFLKYLDLARKTQFENLNNTSLESVRNILPVLSNVQLLTVLEDFSNNHSSPELLKELLETWNLSDEMPYDDFEFVEPVSWFKCVLLNHQVNLNHNKLIIIPELKKLLEKHCTTARDELYLEVASSAVHTLRKLPHVEKIDELQWQMEEAKILWTKKEYSIANNILKSTLHFIEQLAKENPDVLITYGEALSLRGKWLAETCNENSSVIMRDYLEKAVDVLESSESHRDQKTSSVMWDAYLAVARYADAQYQSIVNYKKSTAYQTKQELMEGSKQEAKKLRSKTASDDERRTHLILMKQIQIDQQEIEALEQDQKQFLNKAIANYLKCLRGTGVHDLWVFRLISLWFQNFTDEETNNLIQNRIQDLQSYKFLPLMYQLAARMGTQASGIFSSTLTKLIMRITVDHPHHALPVILALSNADKDPVGGQKDSSRPSASQQSDVSSVKDRMEAAKKVISVLSKSKVGSLAKVYSDLCDAYISLAYYPVEKTTKKGTIPSDQPLLKFRNIQNIPVITEEVKVDRTCEYKNLIGIHKFNSEFRMCGGITLPKVIKCLGTDGIEREQLVKGCDDLRQDAVMQQVFGLVNHLLERETETKRRRLHIRTYKVVPVSRRSGVLQWCEGTQVLSQYLIGKNGAHVRYYPHMPTHLDCRKRMETIAATSVLQKKREIFDNICANYPPVFRYFFLEHFPEPSAWFERRLCYTKSVAASSIVGYILGLGDRHVNNILIDKNTAEVVHIDFGIAFEKGRVLATPETVPFRLTRDIVDGMGVSGIEGTFKRCSEKTLEVMRKSQDVLLTILDVLLHDPLYEWTVPSSKSPSQASSKVEIKEVNKLAERALMRLQQKLQGLEEGVAMSIEGQVNLLIQQARDPNNLCRLYAGWQPYL